MPIESNAVVGEVHGTRETIAVSQDIFGMELFSTVEQQVLSSGLTQIPPFCPLTPQDWDYCTSERWQRLLGIDPSLRILPPTKGLVET
jgi:hypothetical protein